MPASPARRAVVAATVLAAATGAGATTARAASLDVVTDGLANPRGITIGPDNRLYVAEAGSGGSGSCRPSAEGDAPECLGATGAITSVNRRTGKQKTVLGGLPSLAAQTGESPGGQATGPNDVSFAGKRLWFVTGLGGDAAARTALGPGAADLGFVWQMRGKKRATRIADLVAYEQANDPDKGQPGAEGPDSNPYSIDATRGAPLVTDAGGNDLLRVTPGGKVKTLAVLPFTQADAPPFIGAPPGTKLPVQPVPTGVVRGPGGTALLGQLTGFPFPIGGASVFSYKPGAGITTVASGFTNVVDVAYGRKGTRYVLSIAAESLLGDSQAGKLVKISRKGKQTELVPGQLTAPSGLTVARNGDVYVTDRSVSGTDGRIVRIRG